MDELLKAIRARQQAKTKFGYGIKTADVFVRTLAERAGLEACYKIASTRQVSFDDVLQKAARTLVYSNPDMEVGEKVASSYDFKRLMKGAPDGIELPKNTLMVFRHKLTSSRIDRDEDILHSNGMELDPKMLLLWQHVHTMPLGPYLFTVDRNDKSISVVSAIVDMNETTHDAAVMVDNGMGRFSHGFRSIEHEKRKNKSGNETGGFEIHKAEIMEESLVSVPANVDASTEEVLLSLVEGGKLTSPMMKAVGQSIREHRPVSVGGTTIKFREKLGQYQRELACGSLQDLKAAVDAGLIGTKEENDDENEPGAGTGAGGEKGKTRPPKEAAEDKRPAKEPGEAGDDEVAECPKCGAELPAKMPEECPECGAEIPPAKCDDDDKHRKDVEPDGEKSGRVLSAANEAKLREVLEDLNEFMRMDLELTPDARKALKTAADDVQQVLNSLGEKSGRVLSAANEAKLREALQSLKDFQAMGIEMKQSARVLLKDAILEIDGVLGSLGPKEEAEVETVCAKEAAIAFLASATIDQIKNMRNALDALLEVDGRAKRTQAFRKMVGRKADDSEGHWVTTSNGARLFIGEDGVARTGPGGSSLATTAGKLSVSGAVSEQVVSGGPLGGGKAREITFKNSSAALRGQKEYGQKLAKLGYEKYSEDKADNRQNYKFVDKTAKQTHTVETVVGKTATGTNSKRLSVRYRVSAAENYELE